MGGVLLSERERLDLIQQGDNIFLEAQERLYDAKTLGASSDSCVTLLETYTVYGSLPHVTDVYLHDEIKMMLEFSESRELMVLKHQTRARPRDRTSLRWSLLAPPSYLLAKAQDFCFLEIMKPFATTQGRRGWAKCAHSISHKVSPPLLQLDGMEVNRGELWYSGLFFEETEQPGVLRATVFYNLKRDHATPLLLTRILKAQAKRMIELLNHYLKMSTTMLKSRELSLTSALQLQAERRCGACANQLSIWKLKGKCVLCGSLMCEKCHDIVARNFKVQGVARGQVVCLSCAHRRGAKIALEVEKRQEEDDDMEASDCSIWMIPTRSMVQLDGRYRSVSSFSSQAQLKSKAERQQTGERATSEQQKLVRLPSTPARSVEFHPQVTFYLPTDRMERQRRRRHSHFASFGAPLHSDVADAILVRRPSRQTGNSKLSTRAQPTSRRYTTASLGPRRETAWTRCYTLDGTSDASQLSSMGYSKEPPCDISYLASFK
ncbi:hypothetical protein PsorP6_011861 [Peronosclerospora sorghi]|uniref:Uncharacterized protein n=1 Tax=Peronosclerospora sorghi TaxID=230839 RepID=A0ACC0WKS6_9STRA|nr:hypothetical protein PsorP6_011861 [Peronosclerospora sorghi]